MQPRIVDQRNYNSRVRFLTYFYFIYYTMKHFGILKKNSVFI